MLETQITDWLASQRQAMIDLLRDVVNIDSGSYDKEGVDAVGARFERHFAEHGIPSRRESHGTFGDALHADVAKPGSNEKPVLLMGHRDTVFGKGEAGRRPFTIKDNRAYGPGVADMKAGLVMNVFVATAFHKFGGAPHPIKVLITSDEEIGSPSSRPVIEREGRAARAVFNSEPGRPTGNVVTSRKGGIFMHMAITGKAAHSGANFAAGISAIGELAHKIIQIHALTDLTKGITLNVGLISGGQSVNTTAPNAEGQIDMRYVDPKDRATVMAEIERIIATPYVPGTSATLTIKGEFVPVVQSEGSKALFEGYQAAAAQAGLTTLQGEFSGGCADSGFTAAVGTPTICGVGPVGGLAHSPEEYLELDSIVPRAQALALAILKG
ncbi:M20 family metallopeptidase [Bradyrhizobium manausense]|uniref:M20 family metallopeptidase n=1 Tax=Bradyrhizobium manausense TaxID=989370 RepID=UPI001BAB143F|nr:M20 family metallopeptidase [Bradyrhizobium manausense]MBR0685702.1 M20 family metallopeptidase [Bradyrhizobium manausense]MBR0837198.1 M20 family metallopeptidase [Bradyrhizobium manausense]